MDCTIMSSAVSLLHKASVCLRTARNRAATSTCKFTAVLLMPVVSIHKRYAQAGHFPEQAFAIMQKPICGPGARNCRL